MVTASNTDSLLIVNPDLAVLLSGISSIVNRFVQVYLFGKSRLEGI